jgi:hypothetical protein
MSKSACGTIVPSTCVPYTGKDLKFLSTEDQPACDANMDDIIKKIGDEIFDINNAIDTSTYNISCLTGLPTTPTIVQISQVQTLKICALASQFDALNTQFADLDIANELITIDLGCLSPSAAPCQVSTNTYSLISILTLFKNEICAIKTELGI